MSMAAKSANSLPTFTAGGGGDRFGHHGGPGLNLELENTTIDFSSDEVKRNCG